MEAQSYRLTEAPRESNLSERFFGRFRRVGLRGALEDTNRVGEPSEVPSEAAVEAMTWQRGDRDTDRWWPQGITTSADAFGAEPTGGTFEGKPIVLVSWYAHSTWGMWNLGSRVSVIDYSDPKAPRYRHVLLTEPKRRWGIFHRLSPVRVHAGGIVWYGQYLYVAGSSKGLRVFRLDDIVRVRNRFRTKGYRYVLPQFTTYAAGNDDVAPMVYSFMSLDRAGAEDHLIVGEYGRKGGTHRLMRFPIDRDTELLRSDDHGMAVPAEMYDRQIERMQGASLVNGTWVVTSSMGPDVPGDLWVGRPGEYIRHKGVLPIGAEDIAYWPQRHQLWSLTEWPRNRWVYAIDVDRWLPDEA